MSGALYLGGIMTGTVINNNKLYCLYTLFLSLEQTIIPHNGYDVFI